MKRLTVVILSVIAMMLSFAVEDCYAECCTPCIEVSVCRPPAGCQGIEIWTWNPITSFPQNPNIHVPGNNIQSMHPYLFKAWVKNESNVEVHGVQVVFYWASWGLFDTGTPIGSVAVDLAPNQSRLVSSPWTFDLNPEHICVGVRIFHPCDKNLTNNYCQMNLNIVKVKSPVGNVIVPFTMDFNEIEGQVDLKIEAPRGIEVKIVPRRGMDMTIKYENSNMNMAVKPGFVKEYSLVIKNAGAKFKPGDSFDVTVKAFHKGEEISSFTVRAEVTK